MPRKRTSSAGAPPEEAKAAEPPASPAPLRSTVSTETVQPEEHEDDQINVPELVARFQLDVEARLDELDQKTGEQLGRMKAQLTMLEEQGSRLEREVEQIRRIYDDVRSERHEAGVEMGAMVKQATESAKQARDAARVYERLESTRPDMRRRIDELGETVGRYRDEQRRLADTMENIARDVAKLLAQAAAVQEQAVQIQTLDGLVHQLNTEKTLKRVREEGKR